MSDCGFVGILVRTSTYTLVVPIPRMVMYVQYGYKTAIGFGKLKVGVSIAKESPPFVYATLRGASATFEPRQSFTYPTDKVRSRQPHICRGLQVGYKNDHG
jgi:hypothetical protein